ncbi:MAG: hypothetical protein IT427_09675 [Pirellulales bacterium]|nr:hypothetical protein [Pirellulales bacterium]
MVSCAQLLRQDICRRWVVAALPLLAMIAGHASVVARSAAADDGGGSNRLVSASDRSSVARLSKLVAELGDETYAVREGATNQLIRAGIEAKPALLAALSSTDAEVRFRAKRVLEIIVEGDFQRRLKAFAEDVDGRRQLSLPGWNAFKEFVGDDRMARSLFVDMQQAEPLLLDAYDHDPQLASQTLAERSQAVQLNASGRLLNRARNIAIPGMAIQPALGSSLALLWVGGDAAVPVKDDVADRFRLVLTPSELRSAIAAGDERSQLCRKIVGRWIGRDVGETATYYNLLTALQYDFPEGLQPAVRTLKKGNAQKNIRYLAALMIGNHGGKEHLPLIEPMLKDSDRLFGGAAQNLRVAAAPANPAAAKRAVMETQMRDVALVVAIKLRGQDPTKFGFKMLTAADQKQLQIQTAQSRMGFPNDDQRLAAFQKWEEWQAGHQQAAKEKPPVETIER